MAILRKPLFKLLTTIALTGFFHPLQASEQGTEHHRTQVGYAELQSLAVRQADETLSYGASALQRIDVWHAKHADVPKPAMIFIHGGCWLNAYDLTHAKGMYYALADKGITTYAVEYRRTGDEGGGWPGSLNDVSAGIEKSLADVVQKNTYTDVVIAGHSAGGHLALLAAQSLNDVSNNINIKAVLGLAAITDVTKYAVGTNSCQTATAAFMGGDVSTKAADYRAATPDSSKSHIPFYLLHGSGDSIVPVHHASLAGAATTIVPSGGHFDWLHPESTSFHALIEVINQHAN